MRGLLAGLVVLASAAPGIELRAESTIASLELLGLATIPAGTTFEETPVGGLSGITYDPELDRFYAISDDPSLRAPSRFYTLELDLAGGRLEAGSATIEGVTTLTDADGLPFAERVIDGEGIALTPSRTLMISSEGSISRGVPPSIREVGLDGRELREYRLPKKWLPKKSKPHGASHNAAFESLTMSPGGESFTFANESALLQDGPASDVDQSSLVRIARFDARSGKTESEHVYVVEPVVAPPPTPEGFRVNGLVELLDLGGDRYLALERSFTLGVGNSIRLFLVATRGADDVRRFDRLAGRAGIRPVSKRLLVDFDDLDLTLDNVEGMTFGPRLADGRRSLILISDDNFNPRTQKTQIFAFAIGVDPSPVSTIQGAGHRSRLEGRWLIEVDGYVTVVDPDARRRGFWMQSAMGDGDDATSEGLFVSLAELEVEVAVGDRVSIDGRVVEAGPPGSLPVTTIDAQRVAVLARGLALPAPVEIGGDGRPVPARIDDDGLESFDPLEDAIDAYESLEGMRVRIDEGTVVGPTTRFGTLTVAIDGGDGAKTACGGLLLSDDDPNSERLVIDGSRIGGLPDARVGRPLAGPVVGVLDYAFGSYRLVATEAVGLGDPPAARAEDAVFVALDRLNVATYNVWNLDVGDPDERFSRLGGQIASYRPDIVALQEIQDDSGTEDDGVVTAAATLARLIEAIRAHGGPVYRYAQIDPEDNTDGGAPGGNIRVVFLYDPARVSLAGESRLGASNPRRLFTDSQAFRADPEAGYEGTRKPLVAEFELDDRRIVAVNVHLKSKRGDDRLFGPRQPPLRQTEAQRSAQTEQLAGFVGALLEDDPATLLIVLGDFNEHEFRKPMRTLTEGLGLVNLIERVPAEDRYTYNFVGNSQVLDHILASPALAERTAAVEILHLNADFPDAHRASDHDAVLASFDLGAPVE